MASWQGWIVMCINEYDEDVTIDKFVNLEDAIKCIENNEMGPAEHHHDHYYEIYKAYEIPFELKTAVKLKFKEGYDGYTIPKNSTNSKRCNS